MKLNIPVVLLFLALGFAITKHHGKMPYEGRDLTPAEWQQLDEQFPHGQYCTCM